MDFDGRVLPDLAETSVLHNLGLVRSDDLPGLAARWLAADVVDSESVRALAGHSARDPWMLERLLSDALVESEVAVPSSLDARRHIAVSWVAMRCRDGDGIRWAVETLAGLGEADWNLDFGLFIGLNDEWGAGWGRVESELTAIARRELDRELAEGGG